MEAYSFTRKRRYIRVIDIGCGTGHALVLGIAALKECYASTTPPRVRVQAFEKDLRAAVIAGSKLRAASEVTDEIHLGDFTKNNFEMLELIKNVEDYEQAYVFYNRPLKQDEDHLNMIRALYDKARPGTIFISATPLNPKEIGLLVTLSGNILSDNLYYKSKHGKNADKKR